MRMPCHAMPSAAVILNSTLPGTQSKKSFFMAITYASWAMVVFSV